MKTKFLLMVAVVLGAATGTAFAENACNGEIDKTVADWRALRLEPGSKPSTISKGINGHEHVQSAVDSMRYHLNRAQELCKEGKDHESLLHLDVIRAFLRLPEIRHPADHRYLFEQEKKQQ